MGIGIALQEPEQLIDDTLEMNFLGGEQRKAFLEVETHLMAEDADGTGAGAVALLVALIEDALQ
jgi:hypothetical protein